MWLLQHLTYDGCRWLWVRSTPPMAQIIKNIGLFVKQLYAQAVSNRI
jgi:hypothetical protein